MPERFIGTVLSRILRDRAGGGKNRRPPETAMYYVYVIRSLPTGRCYVGSSEDWEERLRQHNQGKVRSTKAYRPWKAVHIETLPDRTVARKRELQIKCYKGGEALTRLLST